MAAHRVAHGRQHAPGRLRSEAVDEAAQAVDLGHDDRHGPAIADVARVLLGQRPLPGEQRIQPGQGIDERVRNRAFLRDSPRLERQEAGDGRLCPGLVVTVADREPPSGLAGDIGRPDARGRHPHRSCSAEPILIGARTPRCAPESAKRGGRIQRLTGSRRHGHGGGRERRGLRRLRRSLWLRGPGGQAGPCGTGSPARTSRASRRRANTRDDHEQAQRDTRDDERDEDVGELFWRHEILPVHGRHVRHARWSGGALSRTPDCTRGGAGIGTVGRPL